MSILKKLLNLLLIVSVILVILGSLFTVVYFNEFNTMLSVEEVHEKVYYADVEGSYYLEDLEEAGGATTMKNLSDFVSITATKGLPMFFQINAKYKQVDNSTGSTDEGVVVSSTASSSSPIMIVKTNPFEEDRYASVSTVDLGFLGLLSDDKLNFSSNLLAMAAVYVPMDGMNEKGLTASLILTESESATATTETSLIDVTETIMLRIILDKASTVEEAKKLIQSYDVFSSGNNSFTFVINDSNGNTLNYNSDNTFNTSKNTVTSHTDIVTTTNFVYGVSYNQSKLEAKYYFTSDLSKVGYTKSL